MNKTLITLATLAATLTFAPAQAADGEAARKQPRKPQAQAMSFERLDTNKDGVIDRQEYEAARQASGNHKRDRRAGGKPKADAPANATANAKDKRTGKDKDKPRTEGAAATPAAS